MKEESTESQYAVGEYVDFYGPTNSWVPRLIVNEDDSNS